MKLEKLAGATSEIWQVFVRDSSSTTGGGLTGLAFNSASLTAYYHRDTDTTATAITLATMTVGTFTSSGFKEIDATNMPGWYQFCPPNAAIASGAKSCAFHLKGATNMAPLPIEVQLVSYNPDNATTLGLTNLDAAVTSRMATYTQPPGFLAATFPTGTVANTTNITAGTITTTTSLTNAPTAGDFTATMKTSIGTAVAASAVASVTGNVGGSVGSVVGLTASNLDATVSSRLAAASYTAPDNTSITAIKAKTDSLTFTVPGYADVNIRYVNSVAVTGAGTSGSPWGP